MSTTKKPGKKSKYDLLAEKFDSLENVITNNIQSQTVPEQSQQRTLSQILELTREQFMANEKTRRMAVIGKDGQVTERSTSTYRAYNTHWKQIEIALGKELIHTISKGALLIVTKNAAVLAIAESKIRSGKKEARGVATTPSNGSRAHNMCIDALAAIWKKAEEIEAVKTNPVKSMERDPIKKSRRHGLSDYQVEELFNLSATGGDDPLLAHTLLWTLSETACRRGGIIHLKLGDINRQRQTVRLYEKNDTDFEQPITAALMERLFALAMQRGSTKPSDPVFRQLPTARTATYRPVTGKVFDTLFSRLKEQVTWSKDIDFSAHWMRHTTLTWVERAFGPAVAQKYARHQGGNVTAGYTEADLAEVAHALEMLTGTLHPLAQADPRFTVQDR